MHLVFHGAHLKPAHIRRRIHFAPRIGQMPEAVFSPDHTHQAPRREARQHGRSNIAIQHAAGMGGITEQEGYVENTDFWHEITDRTGGGKGAVQRADLHAFNHFAFIVVALRNDPVAAIGQTLKVFLESGGAKARMAIGRQTMLNGDLRLRQGGQRKKRRGQPGGQGHATKQGHDFSLCFGCLFGGGRLACPFSQS